MKRIALAALLFVGTYLPATAVLALSPGQWTSFVTGLPSSPGGTGSADGISPLILPNGRVVQGPFTGLAALPDLSNLSLPTARNNVLYTPPTCDGVRLTNGAISSGLTLFTSASATFAAADVGKRIVIQGAGANQVPSSVALNAAGSGYSAGDFITAAGGTFNRAVVIRVDHVDGSGAIAANGSLAGFTVMDPGSYSVTAGTLTQGSATNASGGASGGLGATFTVSAWTHMALSTTIASYVGPTQINTTAAASATVSGATSYYGTDYAGVVQAAQTSYAYANMPAGICLMASSIAIPNKGVLLGQGAGSNNIVATRVVWAGACDDTGTQMTINTNGQTSGQYIGPFMLDGTGCAAVGLDTQGQNGPSTINIMTQDQTRAGMYIDGAADGTPTGDDVRLILFGRNSAAASAYAHNRVWGSRVNFHHFDAWLKSNVRNGVGDYFFNTDSARVFTMYGQTNNSGTGLSAKLGASNDSRISNHATQSMSFFGVDTLGGTFAEGDGYTGFSKNNNFYSYVLGNGEPVIQRDSTARLTWANDTGKGSQGPDRISLPTGDYTMKSSDSGLTISNASMAGTLTITLARADIIGRSICLVETAAHAITAQAAGTDTITIPGYGTSAAGGTIKFDNAQANGRMCLQVVSAGNWIAAVISGTAQLDSVVVPTAKLTLVAFASLPACGASLEGMMAAVSDSNTAVFNAVMGGSGANHVIGYCNGTAWVVH